MSGLVILTLTAKPAIPNTPENAALACAKLANGAETLMPKHVATRQPKTLDRAHDRRQPVNRAASPAWIKGWRDQIQVSKIVGRLQRFGLDDPDAPTGPRMTRTQVQTLLALLRKVLPDMQALEISGNPDQPIQVQILSFTESMAEPLTIDATPVLPRGSERSQTSNDVMDLLDTYPQLDTLRLSEDGPDTPDPPKRSSPRMTKRRKQSQ